MDLSIACRIPLAIGIVIVENDKQAWTRACVSELNKDRGAAEAALALLRIRKKLEVA
jgi:6,7-dimethyl-8-ribityllumazine synthase